MIENESETIDSTNDINDTEETVINDNETELFEDTSEEVEENNEVDDEVANLRKENATLKAQKEHFKKKVGTKTNVEETKKEPLQITTLEAMALIKADVSEEEDISKVKRWAEMNSLSINEAIKDPIMSKYLADKKEERETAVATNTGSSRKSSPVSGEALIQKALKGDMPKEEDIDKLINARMEAKANKN